MRRLVVSLGLAVLLGGIVAPRSSPTSLEDPPPKRPPIACVVPNVKGKTVTQARRALVAKRCVLGKVTRAYSKKVRAGRVISQSRRVDARLPRGAKVNVVVSRGRRR